MEMVAAGEPGHAAASELGAGGHGIAGPHADGRQVRVERLQAQAVVDDHAVAVDAEVVGPHHPARVGGDDRHVGGHRQVEPEMHLLVDLPPLVHVGAVVAETRLDLRVGQLPERFGPEPLAGGVRRQFPDALGVEAPEGAVEGQILLEQAGTGRQGDGGERLAAGRDVRHYPGEETVADGDARTPEPAREHAMVEVRLGFVPGPVPRVQADRRIELLVVQQREERRPQGLVGAVHAGCGRGMAAVGAVADPDPGLGVGRVHAIEHQLGAAVVHVVETRRDGQPGRGEPGLDVAPGGGAALAQAEQPRSCRRHRDRRRTRREIAVGVPRQAAADADAGLGLLGDPGVAGRRQREDRHRDPVLLEDRGDRGELGVARVDRRLELDLPPDVAGRLVDLDGRPGAPARADVEAGAQGGGGEEDERGHDADHGRIIRGLTRRIRV